MSPAVALTLALTASSTGAIPPVQAADSAAVFMYHRFGEDRYPTTSVRMDAFEAQLQWLADHDHAVIDLRQLLAFLDGEGELPERAVVITIDDAYGSILDRAWPLLRERGWPFTIFVATDPVDAGLPDYLDWPALRTLAEAGVTIANHGAAHEHLATAAPGETEDQRRARIEEDLRRGAARLEDELGATGAVLERAFAYPYGEYDRTAAEVVDALGWVAFGQHSGAVGPGSDRRALPRFPVNEQYSALEGFGTKAASRPLPVVEVTPWDPVTVPRPSIEVVLDPVPERVAELACYVSGQGRVEVAWLEPGRRFRVGPRQDLSAGRHRVNCTVPGRDGRYYWFSQPWLVQGSEQVQGQARVGGPVPEAQP